MGHAKCSYTCDANKLLLLLSVVSYVIRYSSSDSACYSVCAGSITQRVRYTAMMLAIRKM